MTPEDQTLDRAMRCYQTRDLAQAERICQELLQANPLDVNAAHLLGLVALRRGDFALSEQHLEAVLRLQPDFAEVHSNLGIALRELGKRQEAEHHFRQAGRLKSDYPEAWNNLGNILQEQGRFAEAVASYQEAIRLRPGYAEAHNHLGNALQELGKLSESVASHQEAIRLKPDYVAAYHDLGVALREMGQCTEAEAAYLEALRFNPDNADAHNNLAILWLLQGDFEKGWPEFEWRWRTGAVAPRTFSQPRWDGSSLVGKTILLYAEQGLGDTFQFIRYAPLVKQRGGRVLVECQLSLFKLLSGCRGVDQWISHGAPLPTFDVQAPLMSLPSLCGTTLATIPAKVPYLFAERTRVERWRQQLETVPGFKVGIAWQGFVGHKNDRRRSVPLACFAPLAAVPGVALVSLQRGPGTEQQADLAGAFPLLNFPGLAENPAESWLDTAALIGALDLVVTIDSSVAHLAGALGRPAWVVLPYAPDWRWLLGRDDSPWYPTLRLFRQQQPGDWPELFDRLARALGAYRDQQS